MIKEHARDIIRSLSEDFRPGTYWTHYKGGVYEIVTMGVKEDSGEILVVYKSLKNGYVWVRTLDVWCETVKLSEGNVPRFKAGAP